MNTKLTEVQKRALRDLFTYRGRHCATYHRYQTLQALVRRELANPQGQGHGHTITDQGVRWMVENEGATAPADLVEAAHAAALREAGERTPAPVVASAEFWPGLRLHNPYTGASYEVIEHTHAVRLRNLRTDSVVAIPQEMARELERLPSERAENRLDEIRARHRREDAARFEAALRDGIVAAVRTVEALTPLLLQFARDASATAATLAEAFGVPHPNACALCGQGEGARDHWSGHDYRPPVDVIRLRRMQLRRTAGSSARQRIHAAHLRWRVAVRRFEMYGRMGETILRETPRTELERAGLTTAPFDQQRVQPDASAFSLPS